jgi:uncharacterized protein YgbK (DUF1537 family)
MIGAIADDFTGATDVAAAFRRHGLSTRIMFDVPPSSACPGPADALVIALKTRTIPADEAVSNSLAALSWLRAAGCDLIYFKYCSTFDSTPAGNIGPVLDALSSALCAPSVLTTPSSPEHRRTQYEGYLFVDGVLLAESHMRSHPLTPMTDSCLPRVLGRQTAAPVGLIRHRTVRSGPDAIASCADAAAREPKRYLLVDAVTDADLDAMARVAVHDRLVAGAAGLAGALARAVVSTAPTLGTDPAADPRAGLAAVSGEDSGPVVGIAGSCSARTLEQVAEVIERGCPSYFLDPLSQPDAASLAARTLRWYDSLAGPANALIYSSVDVEGLSRVQSSLGFAESAAFIEDATGRIAAGLVSRSVSRLLVAGGETSGAIVRSLRVWTGLLGPEAAPGVPWILTTGEHRIALLLKSGNFGERGLLADLLCGPGRRAERP